MIIACEIIISGLTEGVSVNLDVAVVVDVIRVK